MTPEAKTKIAQAYAATSCAAGILTLGEGTAEQRIATALRLTTAAANTLGELMCEEPRRIGSTWPEGTTFAIDGKPAKFGDVIPDGALVEARLPGKVENIDIKIGVT